MPTITLCMIVKNEAPVIRRCLDSVRPLIDHWVIVDTGSTDGTQDIIREHLHDLPGTLHERPWRDFAHNRTEALALARNTADYTLIIDADDTLQIPPNTPRPDLTADSYTLELDDSGIVYQRTQLVRSAQPWRYEGVLHEFLTCDDSGPPGHLTEIRMRRNHDGARRKDPHTYRRDAQVLETALQTETSPFFIARYRFYLAQSYRDCGERERALENYLLRADLGFWQEEVFISLYEAAKLKEALAHPEQDIIDTYLRASDALPTRAEALHGAARFCRTKGRNAEGYEIARNGLDLPLRTDALFVEPWIYETGLLDEYAINAYWSGHYRESLDASLKILATGKLTGVEMQRITANARFAAERLPPAPSPPNLGTFAAEGFIEQHKLTQARPLHTRLDNPPRVLIAILAKQKEPSLPLYLDCIAALDYPKSSIVLYIRTNNNTDRTEAILRDWVARVGHLYAGVEFDAEDVADKVEQFGVHEWNATRFSVLGRIRNISLKRTIAHDCAFYFVCDVDNFIRPCTLRELVALNLPIVAPFLRSIGEGSFYSNYHAEIDGNGYYQECDQYHWILNRHIRGVIEMPLVHCTYLIRADVCDKLTYEDNTARFEYVVFSDSARKHNIQQYIDNRQIYGYITFDKGGMVHIDGGMEKARELLEPVFHSDPIATAAPAPVVNTLSVAETLSLLKPTFTTSDIEWIIEGCFTGSSGIAHVNRSLATALEAAFPNTVTIVPTDGALEGDAHVLQHGLLPLAARQPRGGYRVLIYQHWIKRPSSHAADLRLSMAWWETNRLFPREVDLFNRYYDGLLAPSTFVKNALETSGVAVPVVNVGCGHDLERFTALAQQGVRPRRGPYVFLHVSDCHPRKGADVLVRAFPSAFRRTDDVELIIKSPNCADGWQVAESIERLKKDDPNAPNIVFIGETLDDAALLALYDEADCVVLPTRGEGLCLPAAEALAAGKRLIITGYSGHMDFVSQTNARLIHYELRPATGYFATPGALWAEPDEQDLVNALKEAVKQPCPQPCTEYITAALSKQRWVHRIAESVYAIRRSIEGQNAQAEPPEYPLRAGLAAEDEFPAEEFLADHEIDVIAEPATLHDPAPLVLIAILAKQKEYSLPLYLECIERLDYPKNRIILYIRTNNNTDRTSEILCAWSARVRTQYHLVISDFSDAETSVRQESLAVALEQKCDFYFTVDVDNFIRPETLRELVAVQKPIVAPMLRAVVANLYKSNFFAGVDQSGYYRQDPAELRLLYRKRPGLHAVPLICMTYLIDCVVIPQLCYDDGSNDYDFIVFSRSARVARIPQYIDNRYRYGYISGDVDDPAGKARTLLFPSEPSPAPLLLPSADLDVDPEAKIRNRFIDIYKNKEWVSGSGFGSHPANNADYIQFLQSFIKTKGIKSVVDFGCGDWQFSREIDWQGANYVGVDLVPQVIENNRRAFGRNGVEFEIFKNIDEIPRADLLICKDVLQHLSNKIIRTYVKAFKQKFKFLLITNDDMPDHLVNQDIESGGYRPVVLDCPPFSEHASTVFTRTDTVGGWWHKVTCLIEGAHESHDPLSQPLGPELHAANCDARTLLEDGATAVMPGALATTATKVSKADPRPIGFPLRPGVIAEDDFSAEEFLTDHKIDIIANLAPLPDPAPLVLIAILAKQKEYSLPLYLECIERLDYPKKRIILYIRTNNNTDRTPELLRAWIAQVRTQYRLVISDFSDVAAPVQQYGRHEWNALRFKVLAAIREESLALAVEQKCDFYFIVDVDNFIRPETLRELVALRKPIVAPMLRAIVANSYNTNFFAGVDDNGFYRHDPAELHLLYRKRPGVHEVPLVHMTYLIDCAVIPKLHYNDGTDSYEFIVFARSARAAGVAQYVDTRYRYGYITCDDDREHAQAHFGTAPDDPAGEARALLTSYVPEAPDCRHPEQQEVKLEIAAFSNPNTKATAAAAFSLCVTTSYTVDFCDIGDYAAMGIATYAAVHGADSHIDGAMNFTERPPQWHRLKLIPELFSRGYEFVLWVDADAIFVRFDADIRDLVVPGKDLYIVEHSYIFKGGLMTVPNSGVMLIRNSVWAKELINNMWSLDKYNKHDWYDNAALIELLGRQSLLGEFEDVPNASIIEKTAFLPLEWNSLPEYCPAKNPIITHYAGTLAKTRLCELPRAALRGSHSALVKLHKALEGRSNVSTPFVEVT